MSTKQPVEPGRALEPICIHLRSKNICVSGELDQTVVDGHDGHCWCNLTQQVYGPQRVDVDRVLCNSQRSCYEAVL